MEKESAVWFLAQLTFFFADIFRRYNGVVKTQVIQLDPHDDATSVRDRMAWAKTPRILLVYPRRSSFLNRPLDLQLIQRHAASLGSQLAVVTPSPDVRRIAGELGIPVFKSISIAQRRTWKSLTSHNRAYPAGRPGRAIDDLSPALTYAALRQMRAEVYRDEAPWRDLLAIRLAFFSLAVLAVLILVTLFIPKAIVVISPRTRSQDLTISIAADPASSKVSVAGSLPSRLVFNVMENSRTSPVTGSLMVPDRAATVSLHFTNLTASIVGIPAGTVVRTTADPPVRFATDSDAVLPAGVDQTLEVSATDLLAGSSGNLPADTLVAIEGDLGTSLAVTNSGASSGGTDRLAPIQTASDRDALHRLLVAKMLDQCRKILPKTLGSGDTIFPDTITVGQILSETYFPAPDQPGPTLSLTLNLQCQARYASAEDVTTLARQAMDAVLPAGFEPQSGDVSTVEVGTPITSSDDIPHWQIRAERILRAQVDPSDAVRLVQGRSLASATQRLSKGLMLAATPRFSLAPEWWPWLPLIPFRISVSLQP